MVENGECQDEKQRAAESAGRQHVDFFRKILIGQRSDQLAGNENQGGQMQRMTAVGARRVVTHPPECRRSPEAGQQGDRHARPKRNGVAIRQQGRSQTSDQGQVYPTPHPPGETGAGKFDQAQG